MSNSNSNNEDYVTKTFDQISDEEVKDDDEPTIIADDDVDIEQIEESKEAKEAEETEKIKKSKRAQVRIDELTRDKHEQRRRADKLEQELAQLRSEKTAPKPIEQPNPDNYAAGKYDPDYLEALTDYKVELRFQKQEEDNQAKTKQTSLRALEKEVAGKYDDFEDAKNEFLSHNLAQVQEFMVLLADADNPAEMAYYLGKNPDELDKLSNMTEHQATRYLGRLESRLDIKETPTQTKPVSASKAPVPPTPISGAKGASAPLREEDMTIEQYADWYKQHRAARGR